MRKIRFGLGGLFLLWVIGVAIWAAVALAQIARGETAPSNAAGGAPDELNPRGPLIVPLALPPASPTSLALFDVAGRRVVADEIGALDPGPHHVPVAKQLSYGVYWLALRQQGIEKKSRVVVLR